MDVTAAFPRRSTRQIMVGSVPVGGGAPVTVQSMTITKTADVEGTLQQIYALAAAGADIVRFISPSNLAGFVSDSFEPRNTTSAECRVITQADERRALSIVGLGRLATDAGSDFGAREFLLLFAMFNIFIGLFNLLPTLPFDGGHAVIATYERIRSRNGRRYFVDVTKVMPVAYVVTVVMVTIGALAIFRDIYDPLRIGG